MQEPVKNVCGSCNMGSDLVMWMDILNLVSLKSLMEVNSVKLWNMCVHMTAGCLVKKMFRPYNEVQFVKLIRRPLGALLPSLKW